MSNIKIRKFYLSDIKHQIGASPIWPISANYKLGDYGYYSRNTGHFSVRGNLFDDLNVPREGVIISPPNPPVRLYSIFNSSNTTKNDFNTDINVSPQKGELDIAFEGEKSYLFQLFRAEVTHISLNDSVKNKLIEAINSGKWDYRYRIIEMLYECPDIRFAFSLSKTSSIELAGNADIGQSVAKGTIDYKMKKSSNMDGSLWIEKAKSTPFVQFASFKRRELQFHDEKFLISNDWYLEGDNSSSFEGASDIGSVI